MAQFLSKDEWGLILNGIGATICTFGSVTFFQDAINGKTWYWAMFAITFLDTCIFLNEAYKHYKKLK